MTVGVARLRACRTVRGESREACRGSEGGIFELVCHGTTCECRRGTRCAMTARAAADGANSGVLRYYYVCIASGARVGGAVGGCGPVCALAAETPPVCRRWFKPLSGRWLFPPKGFFVDHADRARRTTASDGSRGPDGVYSTFGVLLGPRRPLSGRAARSQRDGDRSRRWLSTTHPVRVSERAHSAPRAHGWYTPSRLKPFFACRGVPAASGWRARGWQIRVHRRATGSDPTASTGPVGELEGRWRFLRHRRAILIAE